MNASRIFLLLAGIVAALAIAPAARAQSQTGSLLFEVTDASGAAIAGATVTIRSGKVPGGQERKTDQFGKARFLLLPPGDFDVTIAAAGFNQHEEAAIAVGLGQQASVRVVLQPVMEETIEVTAPTERTNTEVDFRDSKTATVLTSKQLQEVQLGSGSRSYLSALAKAPGVVGGGGNPSVHGATLGENSYTIDGVNTTDPVTGTFGLLTNFDIIDQLEVITGGFQAEYGGATGGLINQVTKSGTNEIQGSFDLRYYDEHMVTNSPHFNDSLPAEFRKLSGTLTGPIVKDKLWFALSYEDNVTERGVAGTDYSRQFTGHANLAKLTWEPKSGHRLAFQFTEDPAEISNANASALVDRTATRFQSQGAEFYKLNYTGQLTDNWALSFLAGWYESALDSYPMVDSGLPAATDRFTGYAFQNFGNAQFSTRSNDQWAIQVQRSWSSGVSDHLVKFGFDTQKTGLGFESYTPNGESWTTNGCTGDPTCLSADANADGYPDNVRQIIRENAAGATTNPGRNTSLYVQDTWTRGRWSLDYGLRWDSAESKRDDKTTVVDVSMVQPRLGMSYDLKDDGNHKLSWSLSRRMHPGILTIPNAVNTRASTQDYFRNESLYGADYNGNGTVEDLFVYVGSTGGPSGSTVDPGLEATHLDEFVLGYERRFKRPMKFAGRLVLNETENIIEDEEFPAGSGQYAIRNIGDLRREYKGLEFEYGWNHRRGQFTATATISQAKGNVEYTQGLGSDWDVNPDHVVNRYGYLSTDAKLRVRVYGWVNLPKKWTIGYDLSYRTGVPFERTRPADAFYGVTFLDPRGTNRLPSLYTLDTEVRKHFDFGATDRVRLTLLGTITNFTNANAVTGKITSDPNDSRGTLAPSRWGTSNAWQNPRTLEMGLRLTF